MDKDLVWCNWSILDFFLSIGNLFRHLVVAERRVEVALDIYPAILGVLWDWAPCNEHGETEEAVARHCIQYQLFLEC